MAIYNAHTAIGQREDLIDVIYNISPTETPFMSSIGKTKATAVYHEWQTDSLDAATTANAAVEGADASDATLSPTTRLGNYTQILQKTIKVSGTLDTVNKAGRKSEKAYQLAKASQEIEGIDGDIPKDKYDIVMLKYDNLINDCMFEEIPQKYKMMVANKYAEANRFVPIQINGTIGNVIKRVKPDEPINNIV